MSNEKPVRITVGDVKEVTEATTIQADTVKPVSTPSVSSMPRPVVDNSGNGLVMIGGIVGLVLVIIAGYLGLNMSPEPVGGAANAVMSNNAPATNTPTTTAAPETNAPAAGNQPSNTVTGPADKALSPPPAENNSATANNAPK